MEAGRSENNPDVLLRELSWIGDAEFSIDKHSKIVLSNNSRYRDNIASLTASHRHCRKTCKTDVASASKRLSYSGS